MFGRQAEDPIEELTPRPAGHRRRAERAEVGDQRELMTDEVQDATLKAYAFAADPAASPTKVEYR